jgi:type IV secretion system protein VirD4
MLYTLLFQELYFQADFRYWGELPVPVTLWMDEFCNIALPHDFLHKLTTMRSRLISCVIIIQNLAQIKGMWEKEWEEIPGNCDVSVYLGGNEQSTFEYISKNLGKKTIWKRSNGETKGSHGSSSTNEDVIGRELMLPDEVRELDNDYCIVFVRGKKPVLDHKYRTLEDENFKRSCELGNYMHSQARKVENEMGIQLMSRKELMTSLHKPEELIEVNLDESIFDNPDMKELRKIAIKNYDEEIAQIKKSTPIDIADYPLEKLLQTEGFNLSDDELLEVIAGMKAGLSDDEIKSYILYQDAERMHSKRLLLEALHLRNGS